MDESVPSIKVNKENEEKVLKEMSTQSDDLIILKQTIFDQIKSHTRNEMIGACLNIYKSEHKLLKLFSFLFIMGANALAAYFIVGSIFDYFKYEVITTTRAIFETPAPFPKVTICSNNPFQTDYAIEFLKKINHEVSPKIDIFDSKKILNMSYGDMQKLIQIIYNIGIARMNGDLNDEQKQKLGHQFEDIIVSCRFNLKSCSLKNDFKWIFDYTYGNCFVFNFDWPKKESYVSDIDYGLRLEIYSGFHENLTYLNSIYSGLGLIVRIENGTYLENNLDGVKVSSGFQTDINIQRKFESFLQRPYSDCVLANDEKKNFDSNLYELIFHSNYQYHLHLCKLQCLQKLLIKDCNCTDPNLLSLFSNTSICKTDAQLSCSQLALENKYFSKYYFRDECMSSCPLECNTAEINYSISSMQILGELYVNYVNERRNLRNDFVTKPLVAEVVRNSFAILNIYYESLSYKESTESAKLDAAALFGVIGGNMGLFLGVSLFTFGELLAMCIDVYFMLKKNKYALHVIEKKNVNEI